MKGLRTRGRVRQSRQVGEDFIAQCGENADIRRRIGPKTAPPAGSAAGATASSTSSTSSPPIGAVSDGR